MSMDRCWKCGDLVDTDFEDQFYDLAYTIDDKGGHCESCRERILDKMNDEEQKEHERRTHG